MNCTEMRNYMHTLPAHDQNLEFLVQVAPGTHFKNALKFGRGKVMLVIDHSGSQPLDLRDKRATGLNRTATFWVAGLCR